MRDFFEAVGRIICFVLVVGAVVWVRSELRPKPAVYTSPVLPTVTFNPPTPPVERNWSQKGSDAFRERENLDRTQKALDEYERKYGGRLTTTLGEDRGK